MEAKGQGLRADAVIFCYMRGCVLFLLTPVGVAFPANTSKVGNEWPCRYQSRNRTVKIIFKCPRSALTGKLWRRTSLPPKFPRMLGGVRVRLLTEFR